MTVKLHDRKFLNIRKATSHKIISARTARSLLSNRADHILKINGEQLVDVAALSVKTQQQIAEFDQLGLLPKEEHDADKISEIQFVLAFAYSSDLIWKRFLPKFREVFLMEEERILLAKTYSFVHCILGFAEQGYQLIQVFQAYKKLSKTCVLSNFSCTHYNYFTAKLKQLRDDGIEKGIINANTGLRRLAKKVSKVHEKYLIKYYADPAKFKYKKIKELVNHEVIKLGRKPISLSSVKMFLRQPEIQNTYKPFRLGRKWANDMLYPYLTREKPKKTNYQWQSDCTCLNFYVYDTNGNIGRRWLCLVVDVKSRKILSSSIDKYETSDMVVNTLMKAVFKYRVIPFELVHDNSRAFRSDRMKEVESRMEELGGYTRLTEPENPKDKGCIEAIWGILQVDYFRSEKGYLGDGVRSFTDEGRVDPSLKAEYFRGLRPGIWNDKELEEMVQSKIEMFNNRQL